MYDPSSETLIRLAYNNITGTNLALPSTYDALCIYANVSSTNASAYLGIPTSVPGSNATGTSSTASGSGSGTATGSAPASKSSVSSGADRVVQMSVTLVLGAAFAAFFVL